jgi:hypothetical protein
MLSTFFSQIEAKKTRFYFWVVFEECAREKKKILTPRPNFGSGSIFGSKSG